MISVRCVTSLPSSPNISVTDGDLPEKFANYAITHVYWVGYHRLRTYRREIRHNRRDLLSLTQGTCGPSILPNCTIVCITSSNEMRKLPEESSKLSNFNNSIQSGKNNSQQNTSTLLMLSSMQSSKPSLCHSAT